MLQIREIQKGGANPSNWTITPSGSIASLSQSGCGFGCQLDIYTRAVASNGTEIRMAYGTGIDLGCRMVNNPTPNNNTNDPVYPDKATLSPNPARTQVTIKSKRAFKKIEVYSSSGALVKSIYVLNANTYTLSTAGLKAGAYSVKLLSGKDSEVVRMVVE